VASGSTYILRGRYADWKVMVMLVVSSVGTPLRVADLI